MCNSMAEPPAIGIEVLVYGELDGEVDGYKGTAWVAATRDRRDVYSLNYTDGNIVFVRNPQAWMPLPEPPEQ